MYKVILFIIIFTISNIFLLNANSSKNENFRLSLRDLGYKFNFDGSIFDPDIELSPAIFISNVNGNNYHIFASKKLPKIGEMLKYSTKKVADLYSKATVDLSLYKVNKSDDFYLIFVSYSGKYNPNPVPNKMGYYYISRYMLETAYKLKGGGTICFSIHQANINVNPYINIVKCDYEYYSRSHPNRATFPLIVKGLKY